MTTTPVIRYLRDYIAIPSVNPMRRDDLPAEIAGEKRYAEHLRQQLRAIGLDSEMIGDADRPSILAEATVAGAEESIMIASHLDTVPVDGMEIDPFDPVIDEGRVYGRGACDTKAGMAALVAALEVVLERGTLRRNILLVGESDEELSSKGAHAVLRHLDDRPPDWGIATEPTELGLVTSHHGVAHIRLVSHGLAGHASRPKEGTNAIVSLAHAVLALDELADKLASQGDAVNGTATLSIGMIEGGSAPNIIPDEASLVIDRRFLASEDPESVRPQIEDVLRQRDLGTVKLDWCNLEKFPLRTRDDRDIVRICKRALAAAGLPVDSRMASFGTDAGVFSQHGVPSVVLGPGSIEQAHTSREWVAIDQVETMRDMLISIFEA